MHHYLFQDVYDWAGQYRTVNISKGRRFHPVEYLDTAVTYCATQMQQLAATPTLPRDQLAARLSSIMSDLNETHPFREGNGRTQRVLITQLAESHRVRLDWSRVTQRQNLAASIRSADDPQALRPLVARTMGTRPQPRTGQGAMPPGQRLYPRPDLER